MRNLISRNILISIGLAVIIISIATIFASTPPTVFPARTIISIKDGVSLSETARTLSEQGIIRSQFLYKAFVIMTGGSTRVMKGDYLFDRPQSVLRVAFRTAHGIQGLNRFKVTIPEGSNSMNIASIIKKDIPTFDDGTFTRLAHLQEGFLFPDTYFFYENVTPEEVIGIMHANFDKQISLIDGKISSFGKSLSDIITMASIVEKEATSTTDRQIIAGILWKRLANKMPLQVDPPFYYFLNKTSDQLTMADLATDSPYNLYKNIGLPPTPIDNPGLEAIIDTVTASTTKYFFYLSDKTGTMHYAVTFDGHIANKQKFLQ